MGKEGIVERLARSGMVERLVCEIAHSGLTPELKDLSQMVYEALLKQDASELERIDGRGELRWYLAGIVLNQYRSVTSPFHREIRRFSRLSSELDESRREEDDD